MAGFQTEWSGYPAPVADRAPAVPHTHALVFLPQAVPLLYIPQQCPPPPKKDRMVDLQRSVLNLVVAHDHLALTDPELLHWYLSLPLEDRKIIQGQGGLHQFLLRHPALNLSQNLIFLKYKCEKPSSAVTSSQYSRTVGRRGSCQCVDEASCVFALRCTMCPQHSWRLFYSSAEGCRNVTTPQDPAAHILHTLDRLDSDYNHMKQQILAAVPLEFYMPPARCIPVQGISDRLPQASCWSPQDPHMFLGAAEAKCEEDCCSQLIERPVETSRPGRRADAPQSCSRGFRLDEGQTVVCEDGGELWYDAEDELQLPGAPSELAGSAGTPPLQQGGGSGHADSNTESTGGASSVLFVSNQSKEAIQPLPPPSCSTRSRADVLMSLDGKRIFVPQTWGTMGSVCTLTAQLQRLHPNASRGAIMAAVTVLHAEQKGALLSLPLESILAMTSDLLSRQSTD